MNKTSDQKLAWIKSLRDPYLTFLRNLTPQIILASFTGMVGSSFDFTKIDLKNVGSTIFFLGILILNIFAFYANSTRFYEDAFEEFDKWRDSTSEKLKEAGVSNVVYVIEMLKSIFKERFLEFSLLVLYLGIFLSLTFVIIFIFASVNATEFLFKLKH